MKTIDLPLNRIRSATTRIELELLSSVYPEVPDYALIRREKRRIKHAIRAIK